MKHQFLVMAFFAVLGVGLGPAAAAQDCAARPRLISVTGTAEINVPPDRAILSMGIESHDRELLAAKAKHDERIQKVLALARRAGIEPKDLATSRLQLAPEYSEEKVPRFLGYEVSQTLEITLKDLSRYEELMTRLIEAGVNRIHDISFSVGDTRKIKVEARAKAIQAAKEKAAVMAAELGQTVGKPWEIAEETGSKSYQAAANFSGYNAPRIETEEVKS